MIRLVEALNFRCLRYTRQTLKDFQVLIGPNASGKTIFPNVVAFLGDLLSKGLDEARLVLRNLQQPYSNGFHANGNDDRN